MSNRGATRPPGGKAAKPRDRYGAPTVRRLALAPGLLAAIVLIAGFALIGGTGFIIIRYVVAILALIIGYFAFQARHWWWLPPMLAIAVVWNPVLPFGFSGIYWYGAQYLGVLVFIAAAILIKVPLKDDEKPGEGTLMEYRQLGGSGLRVPVLSMGTATFAGGDRPGSWGNADVAEASRLIDVALDAGVNFFDTADIYSDGKAEEVLGAAITGRRDQVLIGSKATQRSGPGQNDVGSSRAHLTEALEGSLRRLGTDYLDVYYLHNMDLLTPVEETLATLDGFVRAGKVRYLGCSNFSAWHLMKSLSISERYGWSKYVVNQAFYSLASRELEWELIPLGLDQNVGTVVWSPLAQSRLSGKVRRGQARAADSRTALPGETAGSISDETIFDIVDVLEEVAQEVGRSIPQVALNWLLERPTVCSIVLGARTEEQLRQNLDAVGWSLSPEQRARLDAVSEKPAVYPYWHHRLNLAERQTLR